MINDPHPSVNFWKYAAICFGTLFFAAVLVVFPKNKAPFPPPPPITEQLVPSPTPKPAWKEYFNDLHGFRLRVPENWVQVEQSSNFTDFLTFRAPDKSQFLIEVHDNKSPTLSSFLSSLDKADSTAWEGTPSKEVLSTTSLDIGNYKAIQRTEDWVPAGFTTISTYISIEKKVFRFVVLPNDTTNLSQQDAFTKYTEVIASFKKTLP